MRRSTLHFGRCAIQSRTGLYQLRRPAVVGWGMLTFKTTCRPARDPHQHQQISVTSNEQISVTSECLTLLLHLEYRGSYFAHHQEAFPTLLKELGILPADSCEGPTNSAQLILGVAPQTATFAFLGAMTTKFPVKRRSIYIYITVFVQVCAPQSSAPASLELSTGNED